MISQSELENYKLQVEILQSKLIKSEHNRQELEKKLQDILQQREKNEKNLRMKANKKFKKVIEEQNQRRERNKVLLEMLEHINNQVAILSARSEHLRDIKFQYEIMFKTLLKSQQLGNNIIPMRLLPQTAMPFGVNQVSILPLTQRDPEKMPFIKTVAESISNMNNEQKNFNPPIEKQPTSLLTPAVLFDTSIALPTSIFNRNVLLTQQPTVLIPCSYDPSQYAVDHVSFVRSAVMNAKIQHSENKSVGVGTENGKEKLFEFVPKTKSVSASVEVEILGEKELIQKKEVSTIDSIIKENVIADAETNKENEITQNGHESPVIFLNQEETADVDTLMKHDSEGINDTRNLNKPPIHNFSRPYTGEVAKLSDDLIISNDYPEKSFANKQKSKPTEPSLDGIPTNIASMSIDTIENAIYGELINPQDLQASHSIPLAQEFIENSSEQGNSKVRDKEDVLSEKNVDPNSFSKNIENSDFDISSSREIINNNDFDPYTEDTGLKYSDSNYYHYDNNNEYTETYNTNNYPGYVYDEISGQYIPDTTHPTYATEGIYPVQEYQQQFENYDTQNYEQSNNLSTNLENNDISQNYDITNYEPSNAVSNTLQNIEISQKNHVDISDPLSKVEESNIQPEVKQPISILSTSPSPEIQKKKKRVNFIENNPNVALIENIESEVGS